MSEVIGNVHKLWRYPVKSMLGEPCQSLTIDRRGVEGDRLFAVKNAKGKFGSGKNTRRFRQIDGLFAFQSSFRENVPVVEFPNRLVVRGNDLNIHNALSETLGQPVTLTKESRISHFDDSPIQILTTASLRWLQQALPNSNVDETRFRPNLVLDIDGDTPVEHQWIGKQIQVGDETVFKITKLTERCIMVSNKQKNLPQDSQIFQHIIDRSNLRFGVYAKVIKCGMVNLNDEVKYH